MDFRSKKGCGEILLSILEPLKRCFSPGSARVRLSGAGACYCRSTVEMEAFARPLWGLIPFWAGGQRAEEWERLYRQGISAGTDPGHPEYWGDCGDHDQRFVEMAPIALGLIMVPEILWEPLDGGEKERLAAWLNQINDHSLPLCNWYYFRILVNLALKLRGCPYDGQRMETDLDTMEQYYLGDGWYVDGTSQQKDYYSAFAMQFYSQIYAVYARDTDTERCGRILERASGFGKEFIYWFDENGAALAYGRSLTYRFAQTAYWSAALFSEACGEDNGVVKGIIIRNLQYWLSKDIFRPDGILSVGYGYENLTMAERYNAPGSPYWALKAFLFLALPDGHPYWNADEMPLPKLEPVHLSSYGDMLIQHYGKDVCAYVPAVYNRNVLGHFVEKYAKFVYSSRFAFSVAHSWENLSEAAPDSTLAFVSEEDGRVYVRRRSISYRVQKDGLCSVWSPMPGIVVRTEIRPVPGGHLRLHEIDSDKDSLAYDCGFAAEVYQEESWRSITERTAEAGSGGGRCSVTALKGDAAPCLIEGDPNTHLLYKNTVIPAVCYKIKQGKTLVETMIESD